MNRPSVWGKGENIARSLSSRFFSPFPQTESLFTGYENPRFASRDVRKRTNVSQFNLSKDSVTASDEPIRMAKTKRSKRGRLTSEHDAPFVMHKDLVRTKAPAQMLIWHMSSVNQGGSFGGGYSGEIRNEMCALVLEIHQALKQETQPQEPKRR